MVKRELDSDSEPDPEQEVKVLTKKPKAGKAKVATPKQRWTAEEDAILVAMLEKIIKDHIWSAVKQDGRLVSRTSYGVQYHALMLLKQGTGKK